MKKENVKILVADDMPMIRAIVMGVLQNLGYKRIVTSNDGVDAYERLCKDKNFHLAIVDWNMPELDGIDLLKKLRSDKLLKELPVIMLTAKSAKEKVTEAFEAGATAYVVKPFTANVLKQKIDEILTFPSNVENTEAEQPAGD